MEHALHLPTSKRSLLIPLAAAILGAGAATTTYAVVDGGQATQTKVVIERPAAAGPAAQPAPMGGHRP